MLTSGLWPWVWATVWETTFDFKMAVPSFTQFFIRIHHEMPYPLNHVISMLFHGAQRERKLFCLKNNIKRVKKHCFKSFTQQRSSSIIVHPCTKNQSACTAWSTHSVPGVTAGKRTFLVKKNSYEIDQNIWFYKVQFFR